MKRFIFRSGVVLAFAAVVAACTMKKQEAPGLTGPSEFAKSLNVSLTPDSIQQDGASQSIVTATATGLNGEPLWKVMNDPICQPPTSFCSAVRLTRPVGISYTKLAAKRCGRS